MKAEKKGLGGRRRQQEEGRGDEERYGGAMNEKYNIYIVMYILIFAYILTYDIVC